MQTIFVQLGQRTSLWRHQENFEKKFKIGKNFYIGYSPERIDPGRNIPFNKITKVISGCTKNCKILINTFYKNFIDETFLVSKNETAEFVKIFENI